MWVAYEYIEARQKKRKQAEYRTIQRYNEFIPGAVNFTPDLLIEGSDPWPLPSHSGAEGTNTDLEARIETLEARLRTDEGKSSWWRRIWNRQTKASREPPSFNRVYTGPDTHVVIPPLAQPALSMVSPAFDSLKLLGLGGMSSIRRWTGYSCRRCSSPTTRHIL